jgi:hypothetical protein
MGGRCQLVNEAVLVEMAVVLVVVVVVVLFSHFFNMHARFLNFFE